MSCKSSSSDRSKRQNIDYSLSSVSRSQLNKSQRSERSQQLFLKNATDNGDPKTFKKKKIDKVNFKKQLQYQKPYQKSAKIFQSLTPDELKPRLEEVIKEQNKMEYKHNLINSQLKQEIVNLKEKIIELQEQNEKLKQKTNSSSCYRFSYQDLNIRTIFCLIIGVFLIILICESVMDQSNQINYLKSLLDPKKNEKNKQLYLGRLLLHEKREKAQFMRKQMYNNQESWSSISSYIISIGKLWSNFPRWEGHHLMINEESVQINQFIKLNWNNLGAILWTKNNFNDQDWRLFVQNAYLYRNVQALFIVSNNIKTIRKGDLQNFKDLKSISFEKNPLTQSSKTVILEYMVKNQKVIYLIQ